MKSKEHLYNHTKEYWENNREEGILNLNKAREKANIWHSSEE
jgi:hypothetical protein